MKIALSGQFSKWKKDITYIVEEVKSKIKSIKRHVLENDAYYENINEIPLDEIKFSINDQLFF